MIGRTISHYHILERLGGGGMGVVYKAEDTKLGRMVALKFLPPELTRDDNARQRFLIEAKAAAKLDDPNICPVHEVAESDDGQTFIAMAYYEGESLAKRIERGPIPVDEAAKIAGSVARGLGAAHQAGIIHRDIKPANIMLTSNGGVKIVDFGVAKLAGVTMTHGSGSLGTLAYMAPEQIRGEPVTPATDLWALGAVFYEMLTGSRPFRGDYEQAVAYTILNEPPAPLDQKLPDRPPLLDSVITKALSKEAKARYQTAGELLEGLEMVSSLRPAAPPRRKVNVAQVALAGVLLAVVAAGGLRLWKGNEPARTPASTSTSALSARPADTVTAPTSTSQDKKLDMMQIVVAVFENRTGDPALDPIGTMAATWVTDDLSRLKIKVVPTSYVFDAAQRGKQAGTGAAERQADQGLALAEATGSGLLVTGEYYLGGDALTISAKVTDTNEKKLLYAVEPAQAPRGRAAEAVGTVRDRLRDALYFWANPDDTMPEWFRSRVALPPSYETYAAFIKTLSTPTDTEMARLRGLLEKDPHSAVLCLSFASDSFNKGRNAETQRFLKLAREKRESLTTAGQTELDFFDALFNHRFDQAVSASRELARLFPEEWYAKFMLIQVLGEANRPREKLKVLGTMTVPNTDAASSQPIRVLLAMHRTQAHADLGQHAEELDVARETRAAYPDFVECYAMETAALATLGRSAELDTLVSESSTRPLRHWWPVTSIESPPWDVLTVAATELRAHGHAEESIAMANRAADRILALPEPAESGKYVFWRNPKTSPDLAMSLRLSERWDAAEALYRRLAKESVGKPVEITWLGQLGVLAAIKGDRVKAQRISLQIEQMRRPYLYGRDTYNRALIAAQLGERDRAIELLGVAIAEGLSWGVPFTYADQFEDEPALDTVRNDARYLELVKPRG